MKTKLEKPKNGKYLVEINNYPSKNNHWELDLIYCSSKEEAERKAFNQMVSCNTEFSYVFKGKLGDYFVYVVHESEFIKWGKNWYGNIAKNFDYLTYSMSLHSIGSYEDIEK